MAPRCRDFLVAGAAFAMMEPATYLAHRAVMHGVGWALHRSHHRGAARGAVMKLEANDWFPVMFASATVGAMTAGTKVRRAGALIPAGLGITAYGLAYAFVHDAYIHGRLGRLPKARFLEPLKRAHALHHRFGGEPYGMLAPVVPASVRAQVEEVAQHR